MADTKVGKVETKPAKEEPVAAQAELPSGPTAGELEERAVELENENLDLKARLARLEAAFAAQGKGATVAAAAAVGRAEEAGATPVFDPEEPHGIVVGDTLVAYVQNGHQFDRAKAYIETETHRGSPRSFNPKLVGIVRGQRPAAAA